MKVHFIETYAEKNVTLPQDLLERLPRNVCLAVTVQLINQIDRIKQQLAAAGKEVSLLSALHSKHPGQILGCGFTKFDYPGGVEAFLYVGDGLFHPKAILLGSDKEVYAYDPFAEKFEKLDTAMVEKLRQQRKAGLATFLSKTEIGVILSTKPGQNLLQHAGKLPEMYPEKNFTFLATNTLDFSQLENFPFIECFVNTACNRLLDEYGKFPRPMVNLEDIPGNTVKNP